MINQKQFEWAMQRLAQMQGTTVDVLSLRASLAHLDANAAALLQLTKSATAMGLDEPLLLDAPDRAHLPLTVTPTLWGGPWWWTVIPLISGCYWPWTVNTRSLQMH